MNEQPAPAPRLLNQKSGMPFPLEATEAPPNTVASIPEGSTLSLTSDADVGSLLPPNLLEEFNIAPVPVNSSESDPPSVTPGVASTQPLPGPPWRRRDLHRLRFQKPKPRPAVASIIPEVEFDSSTLPTYATFLEDCRVPSGAGYGR